MATEIINKNDCFSIKHLSVNGNDLINSGIPAGKKIGKTLDFLLDAVISDKVENEKEKLLAYLKEKGGFNS